MVAADPASDTGWTVTDMTFPVEEYGTVIDIAAYQDWYWATVVWACTSAGVYYASSLYQWTWTPADQLLAVLDDRLRLLTSGDRLAPGRHWSLGAAAQWSYQLLSEPERAARGGARGGARGAAPGGLLAGGTAMNRSGVQDRPWRQRSSTRCWSPRAPASRPRPRHARR